MNESLTTYFDGEKNAGLLVAGVGLAALAAAAVLFPERVGLRSFAVTVGVCGLLELAIGVGLYLKTGPQVAKLVTQLASDAAAFHAGERPRMVTVQRNFVLLEWAWLALLAASAGVAVWKKENALVCGIALGLLVNTTVFLAFDLIAERRGKIYLTALEAGPAAR